MSELKAYIAPTADGTGLADYYLKSEADKVINELEADYKEACGRLQTANLIKDEQLAATRHQKYKRCTACKNEWKSRSVRFQNLWEKWRKNEGDTSGSFYRNYIKCWHRAMKWLSLAELYKEADK